MKRKMMMMALCAAAVMLAVSAPLAAQTSNTNNATATTFGTDVDNYMSVNNYSTVEMDRWFAYTALQGANLNLGYARKLGSIYIGSYYDGTLLNQANSGLTTSITTDPTFTNGVITSESKTTLKVLTDGPLNTNNNVDILVGLAGMGFKLGFDESLAVGKRPDGGSFSTTVYEKNENSLTKVTETTEYTDYKDVEGSYTPSIMWGMNLPLGTMTLKPNAKVSVTFMDDDEEYAYKYSKTVNGGQIYDNVDNDITKKYSRSGDYIAPKAQIGADLVFGKKENSQTGVGISYDFDIRFDGKGIKTLSDETKVKTSLTAQTTTKTKDETINDATRVAHGITPSYSYSRDLSEKVSVGFNAKAPLSIVKRSTVTNTTNEIVSSVNSFNQNDSNDSVTTTKTEIPGAKSETSTFTLNPSMNFGFVYKIKPGKFQLNSGLAVSLPGMTKTATKNTRSNAYKQTVTTVNGLGVVTTDEIILTSAPVSGVDIADARTEFETKTIAWSNLGTALNFGGTFNFTEKLALDFQTGLGNTGTASIFGTGADGILQSSMNLMFTIKY